MKTQNIKATLAMLLAVISTARAGAQTYFFDNFETQPSGNLGTSVPIGLQWNNFGDPAGAIVVSSPALGTQSLELARLSGGGPNLQAISTGAALPGPGKNLTFSFDLYGAGYASAQAYLNLGGGTMGGFLIGNSGKYAALNAGVALDSALLPTGTGWDHIEMDMRMTDAGGGLTGGTYDVWVTPAGGSATEIAAGYALVPKTLPDQFARILFQEGFGYANYIDNVKISLTPVPEPSSIWILGLGLVALLRKIK